MACHVLASHRLFRDAAGLAGRALPGKRPAHLAPLAEQAGAKLVIADVAGLDPARQTPNLSSGEEVRFDLLSLATGGETDIARLAALGDRLLPVRPVGTFMERWSNFLGRQTPGSTIGIAIAGGGAAGVELALGAEAVVRRLFGTASISLVSPEAGFCLAMRGRCASSHWRNWPDATSPFISPMRRGWMAACACPMAISCPLIA